jgi:hypothetical protein
MTTTNNAPISFRLTDDELELLRQHQEDGEKSLNLTAKRLLLNALGVDAKKSSLQFVNTVDTNQIKELIETAVQEKLTEFTTVDNVDTIKNLIDDSLKDGKIGEAISTSYEAMMGQFNGLLEELQELQKQLQELKSVPPAAVPSSEPINDPSSAPNNYQLPGEETGEDSDLIDSISTNDLLPMTTGENKPTIMLHDGSILVVSEKQEKILILLGLIPQTHNILTSQFLGAVCKSNLADNKGELESLIKQEIDSKGSTIRKTAAILRSAGFMLSGGESKGFKIIGVK